MKFSPIFFGLLLTLGLVLVNKVGGLESGRRNVNSDDEDEAVYLRTPQTTTSATRMINNLGNDMINLNLGSNSSRTRRGTNRTGARREGSSRAGSSRQSANNEITEFPSSASGKINLPLHDPTDAKFLNVRSYLTANNWGEANLEGFFFVSDVPEVPQINMEIVIKSIQKVIDTYNSDREAIARGQPTHDYNAYMQNCYNIAGVLSKLYQRASDKNEVKLVYRDMVTALTIIYMGLFPAQ